MVIQPNGIQFTLPEVFATYTQKQQERLIQIWQQIWMNPPLKIEKYSRREKDIVHSIIGTCEKKAFLIFSKKIGQGGAKIVKLGIDLESSQFKAIAKVKLINENAKNNCENEVKIMKQFDYPEFVYLDCSFERNNKYYFVMEYCSKGDLFTLIEENSASLIIKCKIALEIAKSLQILHHRNFIHRDIKLENIFFTENYQVKLGDLDYVISENELKKNPTPRGTARYLAPEICREMIQRMDLASSKYSKKSDVWALGHVFFVFFNPLRFFLFDYYSIEECFREIISLSQVVVDNLIKMLRIPYGMEDLLLSMLKIDPESRLDIDQVVDRLNQINSNFHTETI